MKNRLLIIVMLLLIPTLCFGQQHIVAKHRKNYPTPLGKENTVKLLHDIAVEVKGGMLRKNGGNVCNIAGESITYSCDYICFKDGRGYDVLRDSEGVAEPVWQGPNQIDPGMCEIQEQHEPPPPLPPTGPPSDDPTTAERLRSIDINVAEIRRLLELGLRLAGVQ